ncbi:hypothetical protein DFJ58DRAFT_733959 [Suillus subalutaceus]|uniref:uncharacterized protein n=1 Tax=Suillus subalutaceus TaxID=48586 RepID=UPI001B886AD9|nr:uncharacterized protein DFJ58DRAFT_733959 [Suillus subalutaceus]KAG1838215.1 hypothetical protein DFJ58DRAFT_733959 [Suillus subalutaceus]
MPCRARAELVEGDSTDSLKENSALLKGVKDELVKKEKVKTKHVEPEPADEEPDQTQAGDNADVDAYGDIDADGNPDNMDGTPRSHKYVRVNAEGDIVPSTPTTPKRGQVATLPCDDDGFIPGSTILGRANVTSTFVKHDKESGYIELKGTKGQKTLVIRRNLSAKSKGSTLTLNGQSCTRKELTNRMAKFNIYIGNLCSFLPQDKVSEFARMTPQQLLKETQRPAGVVNLSSTPQKSNDEQERLKTMQECNSQLERDVQRYQERKCIEKDVTVLVKILIAVNEYHEAKDTRYQKAKDRQRELHSRVRKLKDRNAPAHAKLEQLVAQHKEYQKACEKKKTASHQKFQQMKNKLGENDKLERDADDVTNRLEGLELAKKEHVKKELDSPPKLEDVEGINVEMRKVNREHSQTTMRIEDLQERQWKNVDSSANRRTSVVHWANKHHCKPEKLWAWDRDMADAAAWLFQDGGV